MSAPDPRQEEAQLAQLTELARREAHGEAPPGRDAAGRAQMLAGFREQRGLREQRERRAPRRRRMAWLAAAAVLVLGGLALLFAPRAPLRFTVDGQAAAAGAYVHAPDAPKAREAPEPRVGSGATVRFEEGSEITFAAGASGRIVEVGPEGARVLLETGTASFSIAHRPGARWSVAAGPFVIAVVGTAFDASWSAPAQQLTVRLRAGEVAVTGPLAPAGVHVRAGQQLTARLTEGELRLGELSTAAPEPPPSPSPPAAVPVPVMPEGAPAPIAPAAPTAEQTAAPVPPAATTPAAASAPTAASGPGWPRRVAAGDYRGVVADAEARGLDGVLTRVPLAELVALADAARYAGRADLARRTLLAQRARFAGSTEARAAAFLLGRLADDGGDTPAAAVRWYDAYLSEAPQGAFAAEALGRKLGALRRSGDPAAHAAAVEYLHRYPEGPHAAAARELAPDP